MNQVARVCAVCWIVAATTGCEGPCPSTSGVQQGFEIVFFNEGPDAFDRWCVGTSEGETVLLDAEVDPGISDADLLTLIRDPDTGVRNDPSFLFASYTDEGRRTGCGAGPDGWCTAVCTTADIGSLEIARLEVIHPDVAGRASVRHGQLGVTLRSLEVRTLVDPACEP